MPVLMHQWFQKLVCGTVAKAYNIAPSGNKFPNSVGHFLKFCQAAVCHASSYLCQTIKCVPCGSVHVHVCVCVCVCACMQVCMHACVCACAYVHLFVAVKLGRRGRGQR